MDRSNGWGLVSLLALAACAPAAAPAPAPPLVVPTIASASAAPVATAPPSQPDVPDYARALLLDSGASDADVAAAANEIARRAGAGENVEAGASDALWRRFAAFRPSKAKSISLVKSLHEAVVAVKAPAYGPKAVALVEVHLRDPRDAAEMMDQIQYLQLTAIQVIGALGYREGVPTLVKALTSNEKRDLVFPIRNALARMPDVSEPALITALKSGNKDTIPRIAEVLARISRPTGRDAVLAVLDTAGDDETRTFLALSLPAFPHDVPLVPAFQKAYTKVGAQTALPLLGGQNAHAALLGAAAGFYDPTLVPWILKEIAAAKGDAADQVPSSAYPSAIKLMTTASSGAVGTSVNAKLQGPALEKDMYKSASPVLAQCKQDPVCYVAFLDTPITGTPPTAKYGHVKAAWMAGVYGNSATRDSLVKKIATITDPSIRLAMVEAAVHLSPHGDRASADALDAQIAIDKQARMAGTDELAAAAQRLRARAP